MNTFYSSKIITNILKKFKIKKIIISGLTDEKILNEILKYNVPTTAINPTKLKNINTIKKCPLDVLPNLKNYDTIFIDDDANWYTLSKELNIIKNTNDNFPLVFVCNNKFPNKRRDSYINPNMIPAEFRHEYMNELPIYYHSERININDGYYHATLENTPKNGILTAIEDFLDENSHIGIININFIDEITVLYPKSQLNQKRIKSIIKNSDDCKLDEFEFTDKLIENKLLISYINTFNIENSDLSKLKVDNNKKDSIINNYKNKIRQQNNEMNYKESKINNIESKLNLKDSQIENLESKLLNKENKIDNLQNKLNNSNTVFQKSKSELNNQISSLNKEISEEKRKYETQITNANSQIDSLNKEISEEKRKYETQITNANSQIDSLNKELLEEKRKYENKKTEYENQIIIANSQINFLKDNLSEKEVNQVKLENHVRNNNNKNLIIQKKDKQLEQKEHDLINTKNKIASLEHQNNKNLSKIDNKNYCIRCFKEEISNKHMEIQYIKSNALIKKILNPLAYIYLILKSKPQEISLNLKLYRALKDSDCFDIGFYLNNNKDLLESGWYKYFSPELHYVCNGFKENRKFNKKYFNRNSKQDLLNYILICNK